MKITVEGRTYEVDQDRITNVELMAIEKVTGLTIGEWQDALERGSMTAVTALVWVARKREEPSLAFDQVVFRAAELDISSEDEVGKGSPDATAPSSPTNSTTTSSPSPSISDSSPGSSNGLSAVTISS